MQPSAAGGPPVVTAIKLENGRPTGDWTTLFSLSGIAAPADCEMDSQGRFYVSDAVNGQVYQLDGQGKILRKFGARKVGRQLVYPREEFLRRIRPDEGTKRAETPEEDQAPEDHGKDDDALGKDHEDDRPSYR